MSKVWFITGTSKGFGRIWAEAALERGDRVAATARNADTLTPMAERYGDRVLPLALDVTDQAAIDAAVKRADEHFGRLDVVVNNAGYGLFGTIEEVSEEPPLRIFFGTGTLNMAKDEYAQRIAEWEQWDHLAVEAQGGVKA